MRSDWNSQNGRNRGSGGANGRPTERHHGGGTNRAFGSPSNAPGPGSGRWSDELDSIFERAPKEVAPLNKDDERNFFEERNEVKPHALQCSHCDETTDYALTWLVRRKRDHPAGYADDATLARFAKARSYMVRRDDSVTCQNGRCGKRFDITGVQTVAFLQDTADGSVEDRAARIRAAFTGRGRG